MDNQTETKLAKRQLRSSYITTTISIALVLFLIGIIGLLWLNTKRLTVHVKENMGFTVLIEQLPWIQQALMIIGGLFLAKMGWAMLNGGLKSLKQETALEPEAQTGKPDNYFMLGLFTNLSNPKTLIYFSSVFSLALSSSAGAHLKTQLAFIIPIQTFLVFSALMLILSMPKIKALYQRSGSYIDIISGALFLAFAVWLWLDALQVL